MTMAGSKGVSPARWGQLKASARSAVTENFVMKALSLVLSVSIWAWLQTEQVVDRPSRATVTYAFPEGLTPVDEVARTLVVTVRGPQGRVRALEGQQLTMAVDLSEQQVGKASVDFSEQDITGLPDGLEIVQFSPPGAELQLDKEMTRIVRVRPAVIGEPQDGWKRGLVTVSPGTIEIRGPQSKVRNIAEVSTDIVDVSGTRAPVERSVPLAIDHRTVRPTDQKKVTVSVGVDALIDTKSFNDVPVLVQQGWRADTPTARVTLKGPVPTLREIQASEVSVQVMLPDAVAPGAPVEVRWKPGTDNARFQIIHQAPRELITVESVRPDAIRLEPVLRPPAGVPAPAPEE
jgi:hypothetical protein